MFTTFTAKSFMHATFQHLSGVDEWKDSNTIRERLFRTEKRGTYMTRMRLWCGGENHIYRWLFQGAKSGYFETKTTRRGYSGRDEGRRE